MSRFVIQNPQGLFYTDNKVVDTIYVPRKDNPLVNDPVAKLAPLFEGANLLNALKYEESEEALGMFANPDLKDPDAFAGCKVLEVEFDSKNPSAMR